MFSYNIIYRHLFQYSLFEWCKYVLSLHNSLMFTHLISFQIRLQMTSVLQLSLDNLLNHLKNNHILMLTLINIKQGTSQRGKSGCWLK